MIKNHFCSRETHFKPQTKFLSLCQKKRMILKDAFLTDTLTIGHQKNGFDNKFFFNPLITGWEGNWLSLEPPTMADQTPFLVGGKFFPNC